MKNQLLQLAIILVFLFQSCGSKPLEQTKLEKYDITFSSPKLDKAPEYTDLHPSDGDTKFSDYDFNMGGSARITFSEISGNIFPTDTAMLKKGVTQSKDFVELIDTKQFANGAFGIIFRQKGSNGTSIIKYYIFYFKKGNRFFRIEPLFNNDLEDLDEQLAAFESMK